MKKTSVLITSLCALGAAVSMAAPVSSVNAVGYMNVTLPEGGQFVMVGSSFDPTGSDTNVTRTVLDVFGANSGLRKSTSRSSVDRVYVWDIANQKYLILGQKTNDVFASVANNTVWAIPTNPVLPRGYGVFIQSMDGATTSSVLTLSGQVPSSLTNALPIYGDPGNSPFQMLVNPYPVSRTLDDLINTNHGAAGSSSRSACDHVYLWNISAQKYGILGLKLPTNRWFYSANNTVWASNMPPVSIAPAEAFWYVGNSNFTWKSDKTYVWP